MKKRGLWFRVVVAIPAGTWGRVVLEAVEAGERQASSARQEGEHKHI